MTEFPPQGGTGDDGPTTSPSVPSFPLLGLEFARAADRELSAEEMDDDAAMACPECGRRWGCRCGRVRDASFDVRD